MGPRPKLAEQNRLRAAAVRERLAVDGFRRCTRCLAEKPLAMFQATPHKVVGYSARCLDCIREVNRNDMRRLVKELREKCLVKLGGCCGKCGFKDKRALQIDHVNGGGSQESRLSRLGTPRYYRKVLAAASGYQLLCANCNWIKRHERGETPQRSYQ